MPPFVLCLLDLGEIRLFADLRALESSIEATDVANREYLAYDSEGSVLHLTVDNFGAPRASISKLGQVLELTAWIRQSYQSVPKIANANSLREMIEELKVIYCYEASGKERNC